MIVPLASAIAPPSVLPDPFGPPHPLAAEAAHQLRAAVRSGALGITAALDAPEGGKMFGVLVVRVGDQLGYLRAFSGMLDGAWMLPGFVPPLFDIAARDAMWPQGQATLREHDLALRALRGDPGYAAAHAELAACDHALAADRDALRARHRANKTARAEARAAGGDVGVLDQQSRGDTAERKRFDAERGAARAVLAERVAQIAAREAALEAARADESRRLMKEVHDHYTIANARGETRPLRSLFLAGEPPGGAGDCAAPKLLGYAYAHGLVPLALAEIWIGASPLTGGRLDGAFYPACRGKCGPIVPFMISGLAHAAIVEPGAEVVAADEPRPLYEDAHLVIVNKPVGLLSVPGRSGALRDSVQTRLRARHGDATSVVHRLDLDTSGLLVAAKDPTTFAALQAQFARREIDKTYVAVVSGDVDGDSGRIELALRVDLDDRPRQIVDAEHGKAAVTTWRVLAREPGRTRLELVPHTGRTHQLRVHCAVGLGTPIVGDRLYGAPASQHAPRLLLHAHRLRFTHPVSGAQIDQTAPVPF